MDARRFLASLRARPEVIAVIVGGLIFAAGGKRILLDDEVTLRAAGEPQESVSAGERSRVGPLPGEEAIGAYVERKRKLLTERSARDPKSTTYGVASFDGYRKPEELEEFARSFRLDLVSVWIRLPVEGFDPVEVTSSGNPSDAVQEALARTNAEFSSELDKLEAIIPTVDDREFKKVYTEDAERLRRIIDLISAKPAVSFAVVVKGRLSLLNRAAAAPGVRLVDISEDPGASPTSHNFAGVLPEEV